MGDGAEDGSLEAESALTVTAITPTSSTLASALASTTTTKAAALVRTPKIQTDACTNYDPITAALGSRTIDCLGTIGPDAYGVDGKGRLAPRFDKCTQDPPAHGDKDVYGDILSLLSVQDRKDAPDAARCIVGNYEAWMKSFDATGITTCPVWKYVETLNAPTESGIKKIASQLPPPKPPSKPGDVVVIPHENSAVPIPHENYVMELAFPEGKRDQRCKDAADCAQKCSGGFRGLWVEGEGTRAVIDPTYWLISLSFPSGSNPFMYAGYYHPMSFSGTVPGALYGHRNRLGEACSRWVVDAHVLLTLRLDCIDPSVPTSCMTVCSETVANTAGTESSTPY